ncbi:MAG: efflux RND transporter periplasmic adaptor subunit [Bacteroidales bacterium]|jgi:HlyD family secretion protein|nr:efflux RND transporter periplasmic adaptor subunit [Bacteroidales bacterium]
MKKFFSRYWTLLIPVIVLIVALLFLFKKSGHPDEKIVIGMADAEFINISSAIPGKLDSLLVQEGDTIKENQLLAVLGSTEVASIQQQARLSLDAANIQLELLRKGTRPEVIGMANNLYQIAQQQYEVAKQTNNRIENLFKNQVISGEERDLIQLKYQASLHEMESAKMNLEMLKKGNQPELIRAAEIGVQQAEQGYGLSRSITGDARIFAPAEGIISSVVIHKGEFVSIGYPIITLMKKGTQFIRFNIRQDRMKGIEPGKVFTVTMPGCEPQSFATRVSHIEPSLEFADWVPTKESGQFELRTFTVEFEIVNPSSVYGFRPGMTASLKLP